MIIVNCAECEERPMFESTDQAYAVGWLRMEALGREFWLCPKHLSKTGEVMVREGIVKIERRIREQG